MSHSFSCVYLHIVFSTSRRMSFFQPQDLRESMHAHVGSIIRGLECEPVEVGGPADHIHILLRMGRTDSIGTLVKEIKRRSSIWTNEQAFTRARFSWQNGYAAFSVSESMVGVVRDYIRNQWDHHRRLSFQEEFTLLLRKHGIPIPDVPIWD